jgi:uncharacterized coiled-coil protein SlyX
MMVRDTPVSGIPLSGISPHNGQHAIGSGGETQGNIHLSEKLASLERRLAELSSTFSHERDAGRTRLSEAVADLTDRWENLRETFETVLPQLWETIDPLTEQMDEENHRIAELEKTVAALTEKNNDLSSELGSLREHVSATEKGFLERIEALENRRPSAPNPDVVDDLNDAIAHLNGYYDNYYFSSWGESRSLLTAIWHIAVFVVDEVETKRNNPGFTWDEEIYKRILNVPVLAENGGEGEEDEE